MLKPNGNGPRNTSLTRKKPQVMNADLADDLDDMKQIVAATSPKPYPKTTTVKQSSKRPPMDPKMRIGPPKSNANNSNFNSLRKS